MSQLKQFVEAVREQERAGAEYASVPLPLAVAAKDNIERRLRGARKGGVSRHPVLKTDKRSVRRRLYMREYRKRQQEEGDER